MLRPVKLYSVYLLQCADLSFYCGISTDPESRLKTHNAGAGAKYLRPKSKCPATLAVATPAVLTRSLALQLEYQIKKLPKAKKCVILAEISKKLQKSLESTQTVDIAEAARPLGSPVESLVEASLEHFRRPKPVRRK